MRSKLFSRVAVLCVVFLCSSTIVLAQDGLISRAKTTFTRIPSDDTSLSQTQTSSQHNGYINGHEWVDLGLSVKWATCNVGATSPSDYGNYYAWGETKPKSEYTEENSVTYGKSIGSIAGNAMYDAVRANWGGTWRLPTSDEVVELVRECSFTLTTQNGHTGYVVVGPNGNGIFLPGAGWRIGEDYNNVEKGGCYWSGTPYIGNDNLAYFLNLYFVENRFSRYYYSRSGGMTVRPVSE